MHPAERDLLLCSVRTAVGTDVIDATGPWPPRDFEWGGLARAAAEHGVLPLLHKHLGATCHVSVPPAVMDQVRDAFRAYARRNLFLTGELLQVLALLDTHDIPAVPLKGPVLAASAYGSIALRQFTDLDVLVAAKTIERAKELLTGRGYRFGAPNETSVVGVRSDDEGRATVDLQWALADERYSSPITPEQLFARAERTPFMQTSVLQPAPDDLLLMLCAHAAKHPWSRLGWIADIGAFVHAQGHRLDWTLALDRARQSGGERLLLTGLQLVTDLLWLPLPREAVLRIQADTVVVPLARELRHKLCTTPLRRERLNGSYGFVEAGLVYMRSRERLSDKIPYGRSLVRAACRQLTITPNAQDRAVITLPPFLSALYFLIRPVRLLHKYGVRLLRYGANAGVSLR